MTYGRKLDLVSLDAILISLSKISVLETRGTQCIWLQWYLRISDGRSLEAVSESLGQQKMLEVLNLRECRCLKTLPGSIGQMKTLGS